MLTTRNEFETIPAFTVIAGSSQGGYSNRELAAEIIKAADTINAVSPSEINAAWKDLALMPDDEVDPADFQPLLDSCETLPVFCHFDWRDNELLVLPNVEEALEDMDQGDELPETGHAGYLFAVISDHGNVTMYRHDGDQWIEQWAVV